MVISRLLFQVILDTKTNLLLALTRPSKFLIPIFKLPLARLSGRSLTVHNFSFSASCEQNLVWSLCKLMEEESQVPFFSLPPTFFFCDDVFLLEVHTTQIGHANISYLEYKWLIFWHLDHVQLHDLVFRMFWLFIISLFIARYGSKAHVNWVLWEINVTEGQQHKHRHRKEWRVQPKHYQLRGHSVA